MFDLTVGTQMLILFGGAIGDPHPGRVFAGPLGDLCDVANGLRLDLVGGI